jgi:hypothetical protein
VEFDCILKSIFHGCTDCGRQVALRVFGKPCHTYATRKNRDSTHLLTIVKRKGGKFGIIYGKLHVVASPELVIFIANTRRDLAEVFLPFVTG